MRPPLGLDHRVLLLAGLAGVAAPPAAVGLAALGLPMPVAGSLAAGVAGLSVVGAWRRLPESIGSPVQGKPLVLAFWLLLVGVAVVQTVKLSTFMHDADRTDLSVLPERPFFCTHACLSAYTEASRLAPLGANVYDPAVYRDRRIGRLEVDLFQYPPAFLLLGGSLRALSEDFFVNRAVWFALQSLALLAVMLALALWIGGTAGAWAAWLIPAVWAAPPILLALQLGNFQPSAFGWSMGAMLLAASGWAVAGGALLGFCAAGKLFPGVLVLYLAARQQWKPVVATAAWALAWLLVAIAWFGLKPQWDFLLYQLPRIQSGEAFFWIDDPTAQAINFSVYGLVVKLRAVGVPGMTRAFGNTLASIYGAAVLALAAYVGWRSRRADLNHVASRLPEAMIWLALLNLGSLRSPFVPDAYALVGTLWLGSLLVARQRRLTPLALVAAAVSWFAFSRVFDGLLPDGASPPTWVVATTLVVQLAAVAVNVVVVVVASRAMAPDVATSRR